MTEVKKVKISNSIYPYFSGFSSDLLFWIAINTIFLTTVKGFSASQISSLTTIGTFASIVSYSVIFKIIKKIGNIKSVRVGTIMLLIAAILLTISKSYIFILLGYVLYDLAFLFKNMDNVVLRKNLKYLDRVDDYITIQNYSTLIYSFLTMVIAFISGFLFNINNYIPMILCIVFCVINVVMAQFLYEHNDEENITKRKKKKTLSKTIFLILIAYSLIYATINLGQNNTTLFIQYELSSFLEIDNVAIILSFIIAISRIVRVISDYLFTKFYSSVNKDILTFIGVSLIVSYLFIIIGGILNINVLNIIFITIGFLVFLAVRDPFDNYIKTILLNNSDESFHEQVITYLTVSNMLGHFLISTIITLSLLKINMIWIMVVLLLITIFNLILINKINKLVIK